MSDVMVASDKLRGGKVFTGLELGGNSLPPSLSKETSSYNLLSFANNLTQKEAHKSAECKYEEEKSNDAPSSLLK